ncbi:MAG: DUF6062 family protein [Oscillospiraceae bacterium]|nr:DUF6062 family protein [Oscillospiraceae bacterium]MCL2279014.1 DUF6062 family protein [Oscillospiraceae bacterium]
MKYQLETIPVWDAFEKQSECPLCDLQNESDKSYAEAALGGAVVESDYRIESNEKGYCGRHLPMLYDHRPRLGLAYILHTHLVETTKVMESAMKSISGGSKTGGGLFSRILGDQGGSDEPGSSQSACEKAIRKRTKTCVLCEKTDTAMKRYIYTIFHLYRKETEFRKAFRDSKGFCLPHLADIIGMGNKHLSGQPRDEFFTELVNIQSENFTRLADELQWFTKKHDYRYKDEDWKTSRDALPRVINKLRGNTIPIDKNKADDD